MTLTTLAWIYLGLAAILLLVNGRRLLDLLRITLSERRTGDVGAPGRSELVRGRR